MAIKISKKTEYVEMLLIDVTECLSTELDDVIDRIRDFSEDLYRCLASSKSDSTKSRNLCMSQFQE